MLTLRHSEFQQKYNSKGAALLHFGNFRRFISSLPGFKLSSINSSSSPKPWVGLARYRSSEAEGRDAEYAKVTTLLECPEIRMAYYCDYVGLVPHTPIVKPGLAGLESIDIGNGDLTPEWGVDAIIVDGKINYGPWTDRQRCADLPQCYVSALTGMRTELPFNASLRRQSSSMQKEQSL